MRSAIFALMILSFAGTQAMACMPECKANEIYSDAAEQCIAKPTS